MNKRLTHLGLALVAGILFVGMSMMAQVSRAADASSAAPSAVVATAPVAPPVVAQPIGPEPSPAAPVVAPVPAGWVGTLVAILNTNASMALFGGIAAWVVALVFTKKPEWKKYEGMIITAIKFAETAVPSNASPNSGMQKAKFAVDSFVEQYTEHYGAVPTNKVIAVVQAAIPIVHDQLDAKGTL